MMLFIFLHYPLWVRHVKYSQEGIDYERVFLNFFFVVFKYILFICKKWMSFMGKSGTSLHYHYQLFWDLFLYENSCRIYQERHVMWLTHTDTRIPFLKLSYVKLLPKFLEMPTFCVDWNLSKDGTSVIYNLYCSSLFTQTLACLIEG